jgi:hypothetical protein
VLCDDISHITDISTYCTRSGLKSTRQRWAKGPIDRSSDTDSIFRLYRTIQSVDAKFRFLNRPIVSVRFEFRFFNRPILFFGFKFRFLYRQIVSVRFEFRFINRPILFFGFKRCRRQGNFPICNCSYFYALFASHHRSLKTTPRIIDSLLIYNKLKNLICQKVIKLFEPNFQRGFLYIYTARSGNLSSKKKNFGLSENNFMAFLLR